MRRFWSFLLIVSAICFLGYFFLIRFTPSVQQVPSDNLASVTSKKQTFQYESDLVEIDESGSSTSIKITGKKKEQGAVYHSKGCITLKRTAYIACYNPETKVSDWTIYDLSKHDLVSNTPRTQDFRADTDVPVGKRSELIDYKGSGYDRGHLVPAADMAKSKIAMSESFLLTNMGPQIPNINRGVWSKLEAQVREWANEGKVLRVITGPLYFGSDANGDGVSEIPKIGENKVFIPSHYFKIILKMGSSSQDYDVIAFAVPNWKVEGASLDNYLMSVDNIEDITGQDFLSELDDAIEVPLESKKQSSVVTF